MKLIFRERDSSKARELFEIATAQNAIIITTNAPALRVKAKSYGYNNLVIIDATELFSNAESFVNCPVILHNVDKMVDNYFQFAFNAHVIAMSATVENE